MGDGAEQPEKQGFGGHTHCLHGQSDRVQPSVRGGLSEGGHPELHHPPTEEFKQVRPLQEFKGAHGRPEAGVCRRAVDEPSALDALEDFAGKWGKKYPKISKSWRDN